MLARRGVALGIFEADPCCSAPGLSADLEAAYYHCALCLVLKRMKGIRTATFSSDFDFVFHNFYKPISA